MVNLDVIKQKKAEIMQKMSQAVKDDDTEAFSQSWDEMFDLIQQAVITEARGIVQATDNTILAGRGVRVLTSEETRYYQKLIDAFKSSNPQQALSGFDAVLPKTVIDAVFEDITEEHPLLGAIRFENSGASLEYLYSTMSGRFKAVWGKLTGTITEELSAQFNKLSFGHIKLSAFVPISKAMLDLGPAWLDRYVRTILYEAIANGLEDGIINGRGVVENTNNPTQSIYEPIGMIRELNQGVTQTGYPAKTLINVTDFSPEKYGNLISQLAVGPGPNQLNRKITEVLLVVNPVDYFQKIMPATVYQTPQGTYVNNIFPFPTRVVQSAYVASNRAVLGIGKHYLAVLGTGKDGRIDYSDDYKFLEDERYYLIKLYGTGRPLDNNSFLYLDITNLKPVTPKVIVANASELVANASEQKSK
ncbi:MAG TPA: phage major capsid protein [Acetivibrio sp.]|nr:phage major capsid protein [Acetivibrio sp.]